MKDGSGPWCSKQPKDGDILLHCGHTKLIVESAHWFGAAEGAKFEFDRPDGTHGEALWLVCCNQCFERHGHAFDVRGDSIWKGDAPMIKINEDMN